jgi:hypothetical protein
MSFGGEDALRSVAKSFLVLLATTVGNNAIKAEPFADAREFVLKGSGEFWKKRVHIDSRDVPGLAEFKKCFGPFFNLIYVRSNNAGRVVGHFTLYNVINWQIVLAEAGGPANKKVAIASNPLEPATWTDDAAALPNIPFDWLDTTKATADLMPIHQRLNKMMEYHTDSALDIEIGRICDEVFDKHGIKGEDSVTDPAVQKAIFGEIVGRVSAHMLSLAHHEPLTPEDIEKVLRGKPIR